MNAGRCKDCHQQGRWAKTDNDKPILLDKEMVPNGNLLMTRITEPAPGGVRFVDRVSYIKPDPARRAYVAHAATCEVLKARREAAAKNPTRKKST